MLFMANLSLSLLPPGMALRQDLASLPFSPLPSPRAPLLTSGVDILIGGEVALRVVARGALATTQERSGPRNARPGGLQVTAVRACLRTRKQCQTVYTTDLVALSHHRQSVSEDNDTMSDILL